MATTISGAVWPGFQNSKIGTIKDSSNNIWVFAFNSTPNMVAYVSTDGGATFGTSYADSNTVGNYSLDVWFDGTDTVYCLVQDASNVLHIHSFTLSTHTWNGEIYTSGTRPTVFSDVNSQFPAILLRRSSGEFVIVFQGPLHSSTFRSTYYCRMSSSGVWTTGLEIDSANPTVHYSLKAAVMGASDRTHLTWVQSNGSASHRSISSVNALDTAATVGSGGNVTESTRASLFYDSTIGLVWGFNSQVTGLRTPYRATSQANPTWTIDSNAISSTLSTAVPASWYYDSSGANLYSFFRGVNNDIIYNTAASSGTTWGTETLLDVATAPTSVIAGAISGGIGVLYNDSAVTFDKVTLASPPTNTVAPAISGSTNVGSTLTSTPGTWTG